MSKSPSQMTLEEVEEVLARPFVSRDYLNKVAMLRFQATPSQVSYGNKDVLKENIRGWIEGERTLKTIEKLASGKK